MNPNAAHLPTDAAIDRDIDRALSTLRDAHPRSGLNRRILASLEHRAFAPQPPRLHLSARLTWIATAAAVLAIASLVALHHSGPSKNPVILSEASHGDAQAKGPTAAIRATNPQPLSAANLAWVAEPPQISTRPAVSISRHPEQSAATRRISASQDPGTKPQPDAAATTPTDAQLVADLHAPSHPAPPLPLTAQEKLFLRMTQYGNATQLAELNPVIRAQQDAAETADFKSFFPDPPPFQQPLGDSE
jgi:hypothetical protein